MWSPDCNHSFCSSAKLYCHQTAERSGRNKLDASPSARISLKRYENWNWLQMSEDLSFPQGSPLLQSARSREHFTTPAEHRSFLPLSERWKCTQQSGISPVVFKPGLLLSLTHNEISKEYLISHLPQPPKPINQSDLLYKPCMCVTHSGNRDSPLWIASLKPSWLTEQWARRETEEQGASFFFVCLCAIGAAPAPEPPSVCEFSLSSWLSPGRQGLLAEECMGVGSCNKGNSLSGPPDSPGLCFSWFPSRFSKWATFWCCFFVSKHNDFTLRLGEKEKQGALELKLWLISCMPVLNSWVSRNLVMAQRGVVLHSANKADAHGWPDIIKQSGFSSIWLRCWPGSKTEVMESLA